MNDAGALAASFQPATSLRPLTLGELLDSAIRLYRRNFVNFLGIVALTLVPLTAAELLLFSVIFPPPVYPDLFPNINPEFDLLDSYYASVQLRGVLSVAFQGLKYLLLYCAAAAALAAASVEDYFGRKLSIGEAYQRIGLGWLRMVGGVFAVFLFSLLAVLWTLVPCIGWVSGTGVLTFLWAAVAPMILPIIVLERRGVFTSLRRAWELARRRFWWILAFTFVLNIFGQLIILGPATLLNVAAILALSAQLETVSGEFIWALAQAVIGLISGLLITPLQVSALSMVYLDLRVRGEGLDLAWQAAATLDENVNGVEFLASAPIPAHGPLVTGKEMVKFTALSLLGGGFFTCLVYPLFAAMMLGLGGMGP